MSDISAQPVSADVSAVSSTLTTDESDIVTAVRLVSDRQQAYDDAAAAHEAASAERFFALQELDTARQALRTAVANVTGET